jgi:hypothetical protein
MYGFLISTVFIASCLVDYAQLVREERKAVAKLELLGTIIWREHQLESGKEERQGWPPVPPRGALLLREILGDDIFDPVQSVQFDKTVSDKDLAILQGCYKLDALFVGQTPITDSGVDNIVKCRNLEILDLNGTRITDRGLARLAELNLNYLSIEGTSVSGKGLADFQRAEPLCTVIFRP